MNFRAIKRTGNQSSVFKLSFSVLLSLVVLMPAHALADLSNAAPVHEEHVTDAKLQTAITEVEKLAQKEIDEHVVAGLAIAVVYKDKLVYAKGFGVREVGKEGNVDSDTVFQLASVSKPVGSSVVARLVDEGKITWDSKISDLDPGFQMYDPWVTHEITLRDFYEHRSGLPDHAGDLLEDLGATRAEVIHNLRYQKPDSSFRAGYAYTNFGITEAACAAAKAYGLSWEDASEQKLYKPLGMSSTSSRYSDFIAHTNKAMGHVLVNGKLVHTVQRQPDPQAPAGGVSSSVNDMAKWLRLQIYNGKFEGKQIVGEKSLTETHHPLILTQFSPINGLPGFYGLGMNVNYDEHGRLRLGHSGGFASGAATNVSMIPSEELGIVVLTNTYPVGVAEGLALDFCDLAMSGSKSRDWLALFKKVFSNPAVIGVIKGFDYSKPPASPTPAAPNDAYLGTYSNDFFGNAQVAEQNGALAIVLGPRKLTAPMKHYERDVFTYETAGENSVGASGITFTLGADGKATKMLIEHLNETGEGTFKRIANQTIPALAEPEAALTPAQDQAVVAAALKQLRAFGGKQPIPGAYVAIYMPGKEPYIKSVGLAYVKTKTPFEMPDRFRIGSNTKTFVVTVLLQLQDEHLLSVDDPISKFDIGVAIPGSDHITIRQLAEMRSGLFEAYDTKQFNALHFTPNMHISPQQMIGWAVAHKPLFPPGARWNYSNTNYLILGRIIEVVTHDTVGNQIRKRLIAPMGLNATVFPDTVAMPTPYAHGYGLDAKGNWEDVSETISPSVTWAAGDMISTVPDMAHWVKAYVSGTTNSAASQRDRLRCSPIGPNTKMAFGMGVGSSAGWYGYTGGLPGYHTAAYYLPSKDITLIAFVTAQREKPFPGAANVIAREISRIITPENVMFADAPTVAPH